MVLAGENSKRLRVPNSSESNPGLCSRVAAHHEAFEVGHDDNKAVHRRALKFVERHCKSGLDFKRPDGDWLVAEGVCNVFSQAGAEGLRGGGTATRS